MWYRDPRRVSLTDTAAPPARLAGLVTHTVNAPGGPRWRVGDDLPEDAYGPWQDGIDGLKVRLPLVLPTLDSLRREPLPDLVVWAELPDLVIPVMPAIADGFAVRLDGTIDSTRPGSAYAREVRALWDRVDAGQEIRPTDPQVIRVAFKALQTCHRITEELAEALGILTTKTVIGLAVATIDLPKVPAASDT